MQTKHHINETLAGNLTDSMKIDYLVYVQDRLFEELERWEIDKEYYDELNKYCLEKAKELIKVLQLKK